MMYPKVRFTRTSSTTRDTPEGIESGGQRYKRVAHHHYFSPTQPSTTSVGEAELSQMSGIVHCIGKGYNTFMTDRITKNELTRRLAQRMKSDEATASAWIDGVVETLYESFKAGESVTLPGFGGFYVRPELRNWVFKFNPAQRLRALFGWSSTYTGER
jgi:hypothetical protein